MNDSNNLCVNDSTSLNGEINIPGDKSITHRSIILGSLCSGQIKVINYLNSKDCLQTITIMRDLGVDIIEHNNYLDIKANGIDSLLKPKNNLFAGNSGTSARLITGILAMQSFQSCLTGDNSLSKRPMQRILKPLELMGSKIVSTKGTLPLTVFPNNSKKTIDFESTIASAQLKSCLIIASIFVDGISIIREKIITRDHTERLLKYFDYPISIKNHEIIIKGQHKLKAKDIMIPSDFSSASFFIAAATIKKGSRIVLKNIGINKLRIGLIDVLIKMGAKIEIKNENILCGEPIGDLYVEYSVLRPIKISGNIISKLIDELPILFIICATCKGISEFNDISELRFKESDRIKSMQEGLSKLGINISSTKDSIKIEGGIINGGTVNSYEDHRVAMSFVIAGLVSSNPITIIDTKNIDTSFPNFVNLMKNNGCKIYQI